MKRIKTNILLFVLCMIFEISFSQDFHFSQYWSAPLNLNPALTGRFNNNVRISTNYRNQWIQFNNFSTYNVSIDANLLRNKFNNNYLGLGINVYQEIEGDNDFINTGISTALAFNKRIGVQKINHDLSFGVKASYFLKQINFQNLIYGNLYKKNQNSDPIDFPSREIKTYMDIDFGVNYTLNYSKRNIFNVGFSIANLLEKQEDYRSYIDIDSYRKYTLNASTNLLLNKKMFLIPLFLLQIQGSHFETVFGSYFRYIFNDKKLNAFYFGLQYRMTALQNKGLARDAIIIGVRTEFNNIDIGFSYDFTISDLSKVQILVGGAELALSYSFIIKRHQNLTICPQF